MAYTGVDKWGKDSKQKDFEKQQYKKNFKANNPGKALSDEGLEDIYNRRNQESVDAKAKNKSSGAFSHITNKTWVQEADKSSGVSAQEAANRETALNRAKQSKANREAESAAAQNNARVMGEQKAHQKGAGRFEGSAAAEASATGKMINTGATTDLNKGMQTGAQQTPLTRKQELENKYDKEIFYKDPSGENHVTGGMSYVHGYAGSNPMKEGQDEGEYMKGMKDNWVSRQLLGEKYDKEIFHKDPGGDKSKNITGDMSHAYAYAAKNPMKETGQDESEYLAGMRDDWIDREMLGQKYDKEIFHKDPGGDQSKNVTKDMSHAHAYVAKSPMKEGQDEGEYLAGMRDDWINQQMDAGKGYQQGINAKNAWKKEGKKSKGKEFLDNKVAEQKPPESTPVTQEPPSQTAPPQSTPVTQEPPSQTAPPQGMPEAVFPGGSDPKKPYTTGDEPTTTIPSYRSRHDQTPPPQAAPPKGGMNTGATTDLSGGRPDEFQYTIPKHRPEDYGLPDAPPSYQEPERDYIKYNKGNQSGLSDDEARYAMLTGSGQSSYGDDDDDAARRYAMLTGNNAYSDPGQTQLDRYTSRYTR